MYKLKRTKTTSVTNTTGPPHSRSQLYFAAEDLVKISNRIAENPPTKQTRMRKKTIKKAKKRIALRGRLEEVVIKDDKDQWAGSLSR
jgi:hypothetical protein